MRILFLTVSLAQCRGMKNPLGRNRRRLPGLSASAAPWTPAAWAPSAPAGQAPPPKRPQGATRLGVMHQYPRRQFGGSRTASQDGSRFPYAKRTGAQYGKGMPLIIPNGDRSTPRTYKGDGTDIGKTWSEYLQKGKVIPGNPRDPYDVADQLVELCKAKTIKAIGFYDGDNNDCLTHLFKNRTILGIKPLSPETSDGVFHIVFSNTRTQQRFHKAMVDAKLPKRHDADAKKFLRDIVSTDDRNVYAWTNCRNNPQEVDKLLSEFAVYLARSISDVPMFVVSGDRGLVGGGSRSRPSSLIADLQKLDSREIKVLDFNAYRTESRSVGDLDLSWGDKTFSTWARIEINRIRGGMLFKKSPDQKAPPSEAPVPQKTRNRHVCVMKGCPWKLENPGALGKEKTTAIENHYRQNHELEGSFNFDFMRMPQDVFYPSTCACPIKGSQCSSIDIPEIIFGSPGRIAPITSTVRIEAITSHMDKHKNWDSNYSICQVCHVVLTHDDLFQHRKRHGC